MEKNLPECWGHRGASAAFPENTLASFEKAIQDGAEGIESDVHVSADNVILMFHDPDLRRTTTSTGLIKELNWYGPDGMQHVRTRKEPSQSIPTFAETVTFLMKPEHRHVTVNIDVKPNNDAQHIFILMNEIITVQEEWETALAPRIVLGMWHPKFIPLAKSILPYCTRSHIGFSIWFARQYFWDDCDSFSLKMPLLSSPEGQQFIQECKKENKKVMVWTVNTPDEMVEACRWGVDAILTDVTKEWLDLRTRLKEDFDGVAAQYSRTFYWSNILYWKPMSWLAHYVVGNRLVKVGGAFDNEEPVTTK